MTWHFDAETGGEPDGPGRWRVRVSPHWNIADNPNGGYAAALVGRAMAQVAGHEAPITMTTHFLRPAVAGADATVEARLVRAGRRTSTVEGTLVQDGTERLRVLAAFAELTAGAGEGEALLAMDPPELPPPEECRSRLTLEQGVTLPIAERVEVRIHPDLADPGSAGRAEVAGWIRLADGRPTDAAVLPLLADAFPPSLFGLLGRVGWVPTVELTVHVRARPHPGWVRARFVTRDLRQGRLVEDGDLWDQDGTLVARSRQLALLLP
jgi:acyl-CoA thioesterase